jgi:hypothetical protein
MMLEPRGRMEQISQDNLKRKLSEERLLHDAEMRRQQQHLANSQLRADPLRQGTSIQGINLSIVHTAEACRPRPLASENQDGQ